MKDCFLCHFEFIKSLFHWCLSYLSNATLSMGSVLLDINVNIVYVFLFIPGIRFCYCCFGVFCAMVIVDFLVFL